MILTRDYARKMVREGKASEEGIARSAEDRSLGRPGYVIVTRHDIQRTDHYPAEPHDADRLAARADAGAER